MSDIAAIARAARAFEAQALGALLQPMFEGLRTDGPFGGGSAEAQWRPLLVDALASRIAAGGGLGLAAPVMRAMLAAQEARSTGSGTGEQA